MKILEDYHTHTKFSHGVGTIEENIQIAIKKDLKTIAITDHGPLLSNYGININEFDKIQEEIKFLREKYEKNINILLGIEANIIDKCGNIDINDKILKNMDILLVGLHFDICHIDFLNNIRKKINKRDDIKNHINKELITEIEYINTYTMIKSIENQDIDIITHINDKFPVDILKVARVCEKYGTAIEINNFHRHPTVEELSKISNVGNIKFSVGSDAHRPMDVGNFNMALKKIKSCKLEDKIVNEIII
ncbi:PHP domain-containing protein [Clostridium tetani]|uniref:PHP domain-containing protein n=1 Tax=Clostridium tetani TaxID=1513 RepID=A0ABY0EUE8_CLOTA|nr:PHP domain-containing protein [Clostridium tetani]CDI50745.1 DNA polymerase beta [Clostridium tetani 12124569]KHO32262.1 DNA polymerase III subunit beta [Clostridium tetani]RXI39780.1 PHP domain-containing protein [Clostridium tetani]RXI57743.1 PHP domain-containing protein [Clostridium tetani]RXI67671.1 PHP domain-containing protein [Clostridium tetani]